MQQHRFPRGGGGIARNAASVKRCMASAAIAQTRKTRTNGSVPATTHALGRTRLRAAARPAPRRPAATPLCGAEAPMPPPAAAPGMRASAGSSRSEAVCTCACVRACACVCVPACVRMCVHACVFFLCVCVWQRGVHAHVQDNAPQGAGSEVPAQLPLAACCEPRVPNAVTTIALLVLSAGAAGTAAGQL